MDYVAASRHMNPYTLDEKSLAESWGECQGETLTSLIIAF
jgi:hypothetical protein